MGEKIKTIIEELVKQDSLTVNFYFQFGLRPHSSFPEEIYLPKNAAREAGLDFLSKSVWHCAVL